MTRAVVLGERIGPAVPPVTERRALRVAVTTRSGALPTWLARCLETLAGEGLVDLVVRDAPPARSEPGEGLAVAVDAWIAEHGVPAIERAWAPIDLGASPALAVPGPEIELCLDSEDPRTDAPERWRVRFGADGTATGVLTSRAHATAALRTAEGETIRIPERTIWSVQPA